MRRMNFHGRIILALVALSVTTTSVSAGWNEFWYNVRVGYDRNNAWPDPFNEMDARMVITPFEIQKRNGWRLQNTIGALMFRQTDNALLASGHEKVYQIATQAPAAHREIYILRGRTQNDTDQTSRSGSAVVGSVESATRNTCDFDHRSFSINDFRFTCGSNQPQCVERDAATKAAIHHCRRDFRGNSVIFASS